MNQLFNLLQATDIVLVLHKYDQLNN